MFERECAFAGYSICLIEYSVSESSGTDIPIQNVIVGNVVKEGNVEISQHRRVSSSLVFKNR